MHPRITSNAAYAWGCIDGTGTPVAEVVVSGVRVVPSNPAISIWPVISGIVVGWFKGKKLQEEM